MSSKTVNQTVAQETQTKSRPAEGLLQRKCACGQHTIAGGECETCSKQRLQRSAAGRGEQGEVPSIVQEVLSSSGQPLDQGARALMEPRFNYDFSRVRVHTDERAAESARAVNALAYTVGSKVVFGSNQYAPQTSAGRRLLAHELTHVTQSGNTSADSTLEIGSASSVAERVAEQNETAARPASGGISSDRMHLKRKGGSPGGFFFNIGRAISDLFTAEERAYERDDLKDYLKYLNDNKDIEDDYDSDNKARAVVKLWKNSDAEFELIATTKVLLIQEMQEGATTNADEIAILDLLENSSQGDLRVIFGAGGVNLKQLNNDFHGDEWKRLQSFYAVCFDGGMSALLAGKVDPICAAGAGAPKFPYNWPVLKAKIDGPYTVPEIVAEISALPEAEQNQALKDVGEERVRQQRVVMEVADKYFAEKSEPAKKLLKKELDDQKAVRTRLDLIVQPVFKDIARAEPATILTGKTKVLTSAEKTEAQEALRPEKKTSSAFEETLPGEKDTYEQKLRDYLPGMIQKYYDSKVVGKGPKERGDATKMHTLKEMEDLGNVSKKETDAVFGAYYDAAKHPPLKADEPRKKGKKGKRGNIHDLWQDLEDELGTMTKDQKRDKAKTLMVYFFRSDTGVLMINRAHNADPKFKDDKPVNVEAKSLDALAKEFTKTKEQVKKLNEIDRGWDATAVDKNISVQLFKPSVTKDDPPGTTPEDKDRDFLWDMFQVLIHEYLHTLVHEKYEKYAMSFGGDQSSEYNTLIEGVDTLLDEIVWANIESRVNDPVLREKVEGSDYAKMPPIIVKHASRRRYPSYAQAVKLVNIVGIRNLYAAYFMGEVEKIGK